MSEFSFLSSGDPEKDAATARDIQRSNFLRSIGRCPNDANAMNFISKFEAVCPACGFTDFSSGGLPGMSFQGTVHYWGLDCFGAAIFTNPQERNHRFLEESLELVQALGCTVEDALDLVMYVYGREVGEPYQEVGGVMVTLAALCDVAGLDLDMCAGKEIDRILQPEVMAKIRLKQAAKPHNSALPALPTERGKE